MEYALKRLKSTAEALFGHEPETDNEFRILSIRLSKAVRRKQPWSSDYIKYILKGRFEISDPIREAAEALESMIDNKPGSIHTSRKVQIRVPNGKYVEEGSVCLSGSITCICGISFIPKVPNQINHTPACAKLRRKLLG